MSGWVPSDNEHNIHKKPPSEETSEWDLTTVKQLIFNVQFRLNWSTSVAPLLYFSKLLPRLHDGISEDLCKGWVSSLLVQKPRLFFTQSATEDGLC